MTRLHLLMGLNLATLVLYIVSWFMPLLSAGLFRQITIPLPWLDPLTLFAPDTITVISGLQALWAQSTVLALIVSFAALFAPVVKVLGLFLMQARLLSPALAPVLAWIGKFAMADVFLVALYILVFKGLGAGEVQVKWGLYLFTACILASIILTALSERALTAGTTTPDAPPG